MATVKAARVTRPERTIVAIDGPAASGKGTLARLIAVHYGLRLLDTGLLYRAVARDALANGRSLDDLEAIVTAAQMIDHRTLVDACLRTDQAGEAASVVARIPKVRAALLDYQRRFAAVAPGAVLDGRDIGTVVCPDADAKIYVYASVEERARRRHSELAARGIALELAEVERQIRTRDHRDTTRETAPLRAAADAYLLDTTDLAIEAAFRFAVAFIDGRTGRLGQASQGLA